MVHQGKRSQARKPRVLSLCSGVGGMDLAAEMAGFEIAGQCEIDDFCCAVLAKHWPTVKRVGDIRSVWGDTFDGIIQLIVAGFPCQPASVAGKRRGGADARWLWPEVLRVVQVYEPAWVVLENVAGLISLGLDGVLADLDAAGYESWPVVFPAAAIGAPHQRERVFIVAHTRREGQPAGRIGSREATLATLSHDGLGSEGNRGDDVADSDGRLGFRSELALRAGRYATHRSGRRQAEPTMGRDADGLPRSLDGTTSGDDDRDAYPYQPWPAGPGQAQHEWEPPRTTQERIPNRAKRLKALGNAVVPQQVYPVLAAIRAAMLEETGEEVSA